jgi:MFS family permease
MRKDGWGRLRSRLPARGPARTFVWVSLFDSTGTGLYVAAAAVYFVRVIGLSTAQVGLGLGVAAVAGFVTTVPIGLAADRYGPHRTLIALQIWLAATFTALAFVHGFVLFVVVCSLVSMADRSISPTIQAIVANLGGGDHQVSTMATLRSVRNVGYSLGALLAGVLVSTGTWGLRGVLLGNAASYVLAAALLTRLRISDRPGTRRTAPLAALRRTFDRRFLMVTGLNGVLALHMTLLTVALPLWVLGHTKAPVVLVPILFVVNTALAVALQVRFARGDANVQRGVQTFRRAAVALVLCCATLAAAAMADRWAAAALLVVATVMLTAGELWQAVSGWDLPMRYAPEGRRGEYLAVFSLGVTAQGILGPVLVAALLGLGTIGWLVIGGLFVVAMVFIGPAVAALDTHTAEVMTHTTVGVANTDTGHQPRS